MSLACPSCGRTIAIQDAKPGRFKVPCPDCGRPFVLEVGDGPDPPMSARPFEATRGQASGDPVEPATTPDAWAVAREVLGRIAAVVVERAGWALRAATRRGATAGGALILRELGRTSRGSVARGRQLLIGRDVLVRTLAADWGGADPISRARSWREALIAGDVIHPNLIRRVDLAEDRGRRIVVEEAVEGPPLATLAARDDWPGGDAAVVAVLHASRGLLAAHDQGLAHGDPSADHLWHDEGGVVRLAGLGLGDAPAGPEGPEPLTLSAIRDVQILGHTLDTLRQSRQAGTRPEDDRAASIASRMKAAGTADGYRDLAEAVRSIEEALKIPPGAFLPRDEEADRLATAARLYGDAPLAPLRARLMAGFVAACVGFTLLFARAGHFGLAAGVIGLGVMTAASRGLIRAGLGGRSDLLGRARELAFGGRRADWLTVLAVGAVAIGLLIALGWVGGWAFVAAAAAVFAVGFSAALDAPIDRDRSFPIADARDLLGRMRARGVSEVALREFARKHGGPRWEPMFEALFGLEEARRARDAWRPSPPGRSRAAHVRGAILDWLDARLADRRESRARARVEAIEEAALVASKVNEMTARRRSRRVAEALVVVGREVRAASIAAAVPPRADTIRVVPRPIPDLIREAVETPDRLLTSTWSDDREETRRGPNPLLAILAAATGPRARFLAGGLLIAGFLLWADQVGVISSREIRERAGRAIADRDVNPLQDVKVDLGLARGAAESLVLPGIPPALTRPVSGPGVGAAGLILLASAFVPGSRIAAFAILGAAIAWAGPRLGLAGLGPVPAEGVASAVGLILLAVGLAFGRRR